MTNIYIVTRSLAGFKSLREKIVDCLARSRYRVDVEFNHFEAGEFDSLIKNGLEINRRGVLIVCGNSAANEMSNGSYLRKCCNVIMSSKGFEKDVISFLNRDKVRLEVSVDGGESYTEVGIVQNVNIEGEMTVSKFDKVIENKTLVCGRDLKDYSVSDAISTINRLKEEIESLEDTNKGVGSKRLKREISERGEAIELLAQFIDRDEDDGQESSASE